MVVLGFKCFFAFFVLKNSKFQKNIFSKGYFIMRFCTFMANFEVIVQKTTELWSFYVLSVFCIFCIEKFEISKKLFSKGYFIIKLCTFMTNFEVIGQKMSELWSF